MFTFEKKQNSRAAIHSFYEREDPHLADTVDYFSQLTYRLAESKTLYEFEMMLRLHEQVLSARLEQPMVKDLYFADYDFGIVKSLGAWGGDFVLITSEEPFEVTKQYFVKRGFPLVMRYADLIL